MDSAALIWLVIAVSFFRYSSSRSSDEAAACTVILLGSELTEKNSTRRADHHAPPPLHRHRHLARLAALLRARRDVGQQVGVARVVAHLLEEFWQVLLARILDEHPAALAGQTVERRAAVHHGHRAIAGHEAERRLRPGVDQHGAH